MSEKKIYTYILEFHNNQSMDFPYIRIDTYTAANGLQQNIRHLLSRLQYMDQHIFDWNKPSFSDNLDC